MADFVVQTTSDNAVIAAGESRTIQFRPAEPGNVAVRSVPAQPAAHSESGFLGSLDLRRPGSTQPLASSETRTGGTVLALRYQATAADLVTPGNWTCEVANATDVDQVFDTEISYPSSTPAPQVVNKTATFDVGLLNLIIAEAVTDSGLSWHLESSASDADPESFVAWSPAVADTLPGAWRGQIYYPFRIADYRKDSDFDVGTVNWVVVRIVNFDADPTSPVSVALTASGGAAQLAINVTFQADTAKLVVIDSDVDLDKVDLEVDINSLVVSVIVGFDGSLSATADAVLTLLVAGVEAADLSQGMSVTMQDALNNGWITNLQTELVQAYLNKFFVSLMRLGPQAEIQSYESDGVTLTVNYTVPAPAGVPPPTPPQPPILAEAAPN
jgi:hypothetical protein